MSAHHGSTPAAWTAVTLALIALCVGGAGLVLDVWPVFWAGGALLALSIVVGKVMQVMGMGAE